MKKMNIVFAVLASLFCLAGGIVMIAPLLGWSDINDGREFQVGLALYMIGKGFFVGPMLMK